MPIEYEYTYYNLKERILTELQPGGRKWDELLYRKPDKYQARKRLQFINVLKRLAKLLNDPVNADVETTYWDWKELPTVVLDYDDMDASIAGFRLIYPELKEPKDVMYAGDVTYADLGYDTEAFLTEVVEELKNTIDIMVEEGVEKGTTDRYEKEVMQLREELGAAITEQEAARKRYYDETITRKDYQRQVKRLASKVDMLQKKVVATNEEIADLRAKRRVKRPYKGLHEVPYDHKTKLYGLWKGTIAAKLTKYLKELDENFEVIWEELERDLAKEPRKKAFVLAKGIVEQRAIELADLSPKLRAIAIKESAELRRLEALKKKEKKVPPRERWNDEIVAERRLAFPSRWI